MRSSIWHRTPIILLAGLALGLPSTAANAEWAHTEAAIMGTQIQVEVWHDNPNVRQAALDTVIAEMHRIDGAMSTYKRDSLISRVNREAADHPVDVGTELAGLVGDALRMSKLSNGAFDITYESVGYLYDYRSRQQPNQKAIEAALPALDYRYVLVDEEKGTIAFAKRGVKINLGGIAKGYAVERAVEMLRAIGVENALVSAGGDTRVLGSRQGRPWRVGIRDPRAEGKVVAVLDLADEAISTSGDYERFFDDEDGSRVHHIIEPGTGRSARKVRSTTIVGPDAMLTDALSTSVFVMGVEHGMELIDLLPDIEAVIVDNDGKLFYSKGFEEESDANNKLGEARH